ncbi:hypothetical protein [Acetobacter fallax]|uniref:Uncharacterized protein n=1 Tax=Acetobacter fallax TaxID=1737473 RepID=A0ABX0KKP0_9PROT|nr:hypothetical protein [Acetobacter fallax]NHO34442.1 hypothetical protein [Acetobacter fallax]NHO38004.1 hypothetical protein [Acetobacter fallax]
MTATICLRIYSLYVYKEGDRERKKTAYKDIAGLKDFVTSYISAMPSENTDDKLARSWYFEQKNTNEPDREQGYIHYGNYGYSSRFKNRVSKKYVYDRSTSDVEEIPLYYNFWMPNKEDIFFSFQNFQGRSCIQLIFQSLQDWFSKNHKGYKLSVRKIVPHLMRGTTFAEAPVKKLTLSRRKSPSDVTDRYTGGNAEEVNLELRISATRSKHLGSLLSLIDRFKHPETKMLTFGDIVFEEASAEIKIGGKPRKVGVFGYDKDAGLIDITDEIKFSDNGHPEFDSIREQSTELLDGIYSAFGEQK